MGRKRCGKRRNCLFQAISPFPTTFSKDLKESKNQGLFGKGLGSSKCTISKKIKSVDTGFHKIVEHEDQDTESVVSNFNLYCVQKTRSTEVMFITQRVSAAAAKHIYL